VKLLDDLAAAVKKLPRRRAALLAENLRMGMIDVDLRAAILASKLTPYAIAQAAGTSPDQITRFIRGERDLRLGTAAKVAAVLRLELRPVKPTKRAKH
jgi:hypothetical protein